MGHCFSMRSARCLSSCNRTSCAFSKAEAVSAGGEPAAQRSVQADRLDQQGSPGGGRCRSVSPGLVLPGIGHDAPHPRAARAQGGHRRAGRAFQPGGVAPPRRIRETVRGGGHRGARAICMAGKRARNATRGRRHGDVDQRCHRHGSRATGGDRVLGRRSGRHAPRLSRLRGGSGSRRRRARRHQHGDRATPRQPDDGCQRPANLEEHALPQNRQVRAEPDSSPGSTARPIDVLSTHRPDIGRRPNIGRGSEVALARCRDSAVEINRALRSARVTTSGTARLLPTPCGRSTDTRGHDMRAPSETAAQEWDAKGSCVSPEGRIREMVARGMSLSHVLDGLCRLVEEQAPGVLASVLADLAHVTRLTTLGQLAPSPAHEAAKTTSSEAECHGDVCISDIVGHSEAMRRVLKAVATVAPTDSTVLIGGETGTGKELIARAIHNRSRRRSRPFVTLNCAAIPSGLRESELFGQEKGAFTGAVVRRVGRFELANGGTLFLDEIGDIPLDLQPKLLRVLQEQAFERLGSTQTIRVGVRLIAATNLDLSTMVAEKRFRNDLYYRLNVFPIVIPPLRDRREDVPALVDYFMRMYAGRLNRQVEPASPAALKALTEYDWPGNVRELANVVERASIEARAGDLRVDLPPGGDRNHSAGRGAVSGAASPGEILSEAQMRQQERENIAAALRRTRGKIYGEDGAASLLGIKPTTLLSRLAKLGLKPTRQVPLASAQAT